MIEKNIKAVVKEQNHIKGIVHFENMRGPNGLSAYEIYVANFPEGETPLSEQEWLNSLNKANYYKQYKDTYTVLEDNTTTIPINIPQYNSTTLLDVYINGLRLNENEYTINDTNIILTLPVSKGTEIHKVVSKTVVATQNDYDLLAGNDGATFTPSVSETGDLSWTNDKGLENPTTVNIKGADGQDGADGLGVPSGGTTGQVLVKKSDVDNDTEWVDYVASGGDSLPIGTVFPWFSNDIPTNFLELNGQAVSRTIYSDLFELYGTTYGTGDGSTTFNLPNLSGRVPVGLDSDDTDFNEVGKTYGEKDHTLLEEELAEHVHKGLEFWNKAVTFDAGSGEGYNLQYGNSINPGYVAELWTNESGGNQPHNNVQPSIVVKYIVKAQYSDGHLSEEAEVIDNFDSTSSTNALSANMGRELKAMLDTFFQKKIFLKATASTIQNLSSNTNINLDTVSYTNDNTNEFFKLENGSIKVVSSAINSIKVSGAINVENAQLNGYLWVRVKKNNTTVAGQIVNHQEGIGYIGGVIPSTIIDVSEGDVITLNVDCPIIAKTRGASYDKFLMVETVSANINTTTSFNYEVIQNQNGTAIKYNDGRLECYGLVNATDLPNNMWGPFYSKDKNITFPVEFIEKPTVVANAYGNSGMYFCGLGSDSSLTTTGCTIRLMSVQTIQATEYWFTYRAVGRWKE